MAESPLEALTALAAALDAEASAAQLERALPIVARTLSNALRTDALPDLGETEPAFGLRFDAGALELGSEAPDGSS